MMNVGYHIPSTAVVFSIGVRSDERAKEQERFANAESLKLYSIGAYRIPCGGSRPYPRGDDSSMNFIATVRMGEIFDGDSGDRDQGDMDVFRLEDAICFARNVLHVCVLANKQVLDPRLGDKMRNGDVGVSG